MRVAGLVTSADGDRTGDPALNPGAGIRGSTVSPIEANVRHSGTGGDCWR